MATRIPLFIVCQNPKCGAIKTVRNRYEQRRRRFCSKRCSGTMTKNLRLVACTESGRRGGLASGRTRRAALLVKLRGKTQLEAYKIGRIEGWHAGARSVRRRLEMS